MRPNWQFSVFPTGELPYVDMPERFCAGYDGFVGAAD